MSFPRYPKYKDSGVEWVGQVPDHWEVGPVKRFFKVLDGLRVPLSTEERSYRQGDFPYYGASGIIDYVDDFIFDEDMVLVSEDGANLLARATPIAFVAKGRYWVNNHAHILKAPDDALTFWSERIEAIDLTPVVTGAAQPKLTIDALANLVIAVPSTHNERKKIARFVETEVTRIDALVAEQEQLITLLKEKRQAVISHAVTKGLDPSVPMKDSGVEWLGEVPAHWALTTLARISAAKCDGPFGSGLKSDHYTESGALVVRLQNIRSFGFHGGEPAYLDLGYFQSELYRHNVVAGDVLIAGLGDDNNLVGRACVAPRGIEPALVKADCFRFRLRAGMAVAEFIAHQLSTSAFCDSGRLSSGSTRSRISLGVMGTRVVVLPPIAEQTALVQFIEAEMHKLDELLAEALGAISFLQERRAALISAAVTGQIDVRNLAPEPA
jgi:type I restriction enzyme S subunit